MIVDAYLVSTGSSGPLCRQGQLNECGSAICGGAPSLVHWLVSLTSRFCRGFTRKIVRPRDGFAGLTTSTCTWSRWEEPIPLVLRFVPLRRRAGGRMTIGDDSLPDGTQPAAAGGAPAVRAQSSAVAPVDGRNIESSPPGRQVGEPTYAPRGRVWSPEPGRRPVRKPKRRSSCRKPSG